MVTLRPSYRGYALPPDLPAIPLSGLQGVEREAVERYFAYYRIDASPEAIAWWRPTDGLLLDIFCRTVNPRREKTVRAEEVPESLTEVFAAYLKALLARVGRTMDIAPEEVESAVLRLAGRFLDAGSRELD